MIGSYTERLTVPARDEQAIRLGEQARPAPVGIPAHAEQALAPTAIRNCPHCEQPVTIVALLATPEAARPSVTHRVPDITPLRRTP